MDKQTQLKRFYPIFLVSTFLIFITSSTHLFAGSFDSEDNRTIGYEFLDDNGNIVATKPESTYLHIWNTQDSYFFNSSSGVQFGNNFQEYWTKNVFCGGYKDAQNEWIYDCNDALPFTWSIDDGTDYVNITGYWDRSVGGATVRAEVTYSLYEDDKNLSITFSVENIGDKDITTNLGFAWRAKDIQIANTKDNDWIRVWNDSKNIKFQLNETLHMNFTNLNRTQYELHDGELLRLSWNENLNYKLMVDSVPSQYNAPVTLGINIGNLSVGEKKQTTMYWIDAVTFSSVATGTTAALSDEMQWAHNIVCGDDMVLIVGVATDSEAGPAALSVKYNNIDLHKLASFWSSDSEVAVDMWNLTNPPCGQSYNIDVDFRVSNAEEGAGISTVYYGIDRIENESLRVAMSATNGASSLVVPTTSSDQIVVDMIAVDNDALSVFNPTGSDNQMQRAEVDGADRVLLGTSDGWASDGTVTMEWGGGFTDQWATIGVPLIPAGPAFSSPAINVTPYIFEGFDVNHSITIGNNISNYVFSWNGSNNCDGIWINSTNTTVTASRRIEAHNVSTIETCGGETIGWRFWANNSVNSTSTWSASDIETYYVWKYGTLTVNLTVPLNNTDTNYTDINATVICSGGAGSRCGLVDAYARYNLTGYEPNQLINTTNNASPMFLVGEKTDAVAYWRPIDWDIEGGASSPELGIDQRYNDTTTKALIAAGLSSTGFLNYTYNLPSYIDSAIISVTATEASTATSELRLYNYNTNQVDAWTSLTTTTTTYVKIITKDNGYISSEGLVKLDTTANSVATDSTLEDTYITTSGNTYDYLGVEPLSLLINASAGNSVTRPSQGTKIWDGPKYSSSNYQEVSISDDSKRSTSAEAKYLFHRFHIKINESVSSIKSINPVIEGYFSNGNSEFFIWNKTKWSLIGIITTNTDDDIGLHSEINVPISDYIDTDDYLHLLFETVDTGFSGQFLFVDYIKVNIIPPEAADNPQTPLESLENGESFNVSWTVNVTGTDHYLLDVYFNSSTYGEDNVVGTATGYHRICVRGCPSGEPPVDITPPEYSNFNKNITDANIYTDSAIQFNITISDVDNTVLYWNFSTNLTVGETWNNITNSTDLTNPSQVNVTIAGKSVGDVFGYMFCSSDDQGNVGCDTLRTFEIQTKDTCTFPAINLNHVIEDGDVCKKTNWKNDMGTGNLTITEDSRLILVDSNLTLNIFIPNATTADIRIFNFSCSAANLCYFNISGLAK